MENTHYDIQARNEIIWGALKLLLATALTGGVIGFFIKSLLLYGILIGLWIVLLLISILSTSWMLVVIIGLVGFLILFFMGISRILT